MNWGAPFGGPLHSSHFRERGARSVSGGPPFSSLVKDSFLGGPAPGGLGPQSLAKDPTLPALRWLRPEGGREIPFGDDRPRRRPAPWRLTPTKATADDHRPQNL